MTAQLSRERLGALANLQSLECMALPASHAEAAEMARMLLAGMDSKLVAYLIQDKDDRCHGRSGRLSHHSIKSYRDEDIVEYELSQTPLYAAPPATVAVPDDSAVELLATDIMKRIDKITDERHSVATLSSLRVSIVEACRAVMLKAGPVTAATVPEKCWCRTCRPVGITDMRFVVCPDCGNKRCPRANDHRNACSGSNEPGQVGSAYPAAPEQEV